MSLRILGIMLVSLPIILTGGCIEIDGDDPPSPTDTITPPPPTPEERLAGKYTLLGMRYHREPRSFDAPEGVVGTLSLGSGGGAWFRNLRFPEGNGGEWERQHGKAELISRAEGKSWSASETELSLIQTGAESLNLYYQYSLGISDHLLQLKAFTDDGELAATWSWKRE